MGVIHCRNKEKTLAVITPPKCGTTLLSHLTELSEFKDRVYVDDQQDLENRDLRIFCVRDHYSRVLSTYLDKIVIQDASAYANHNGWRAKGHTTPPTEIYGPESAWCNFKAYTMNLGICQWWDSHIQPYLASPFFSFAFWSTIRHGRSGPGFRGEDIPGVNTKAKWASPRDVATGSVLNEINAFLELPLGTHHKEWSEILEKTKRHKVNYSFMFKPPEHYCSGARYWSDVDRDTLYQIYLETGTVPAAELMYEDPQVVMMVANQMAYTLDNYEMTKAGAPSVLAGAAETYQKYAKQRESRENQ